MQESLFLPLTSKKKKKKQAINRSERRTLLLFPLTRIYSNS